MLAAGVSAVQVLAGLAVFSLSSNRDDRYLLPSPVLRPVPLLGRRPLEPAAGDRLLIAAFALHGATRTHRHSG